MGHSERRHTVAAESNELIAEKAKVALANGVKVILCIGELLEDRESGKTMEVCKAQLQAVVDAVEEKDWENIVIAYEPVWAIGTGKTATPDVAEAEKLARGELREKNKDEVTGRIALTGAVNNSLLSCLE